MKKILLFTLGVFLFASLSVNAAPMSVSQANNFNSIFNAYHLVNTDEASSSTKYYGFTKYDGYWFIMKEDISSDLHIYTFISGTANYSTNWTGRAGLSYTTFTAVFSQPI